MPHLELLLKVKVDVTVVQKMRIPAVSTKKKLAQDWECQSSTFRVYLIRMYLIESAILFKLIQYSSSINIQKAEQSQNPHPTSITQW